MKKLALLVGIGCGLAAFCHASNASLLDWAPDRFGGSTPLATDIALALTAASGATDQTAGLWFAMRVTLRPSEDDSSLPDNMVREALAMGSEQPLPADEADPARPRNRPIGKAGADNGSSRMARGGPASDDPWGGNKLDRSYGADPEPAAAPAPAPAQDSKQDPNRREPAEHKAACCGSESDQASVDSHSASTDGPGAGLKEHRREEALDTFDDSFHYQARLAVEMSAAAAEDPASTFDLTRPDPVTPDLPARPLPARQDGFGSAAHVSRNQVEAFLQIMLEPSVVSSALIAVGVSLSVVSLRAIWVSSLMFVVAAVWFFYSNL